MIYSSFLINIVYCYVCYCYVCLLLCLLYIVPLNDILKTYKKVLVPRKNLIIYRSFRTMDGRTNDIRNSLITRTSTLKIKELLAMNLLKQQQLELRETISGMVTSLCDTVKSTSSLKTKSNL